MDQLALKLSSFMHEPHGEVEIRLGRLEFGSFNTSIPADHWNVVMKRLRSNKKWTRVSENVFEDSLYPNKTRIRTQLPDRSVSTCTKQNVWTLDVPNPSAWCDLRISFAIEHPLATPPRDQRASNTVLKRRTRFVHKDLWAFDLTHATYARPLDKDQETPDVYMIEIELLDRSKPATYLADYGISLARDLLSMIPCA